MSSDALVSTEIVLLCATRFADFRHRQGTVVPGTNMRVAPTQLGRTLALVALVSCHERGHLRLALEHKPLVLGFGRRESVHVSMGMAETSPPTATLEATVTMCARDEASVRGLLRDAVRSTDGARSLTDVVRLGMVTRGLLSRDDDGVDEPTAEAASAATSEAADEVQRQLSNFRAENPELAAALRKEIERFAWTHGVDAIAPVPRGPFRRPRQRSEVDLSDWNRLNRDPPSATKTKDLSDWDRLNADPPSATKKKD